MASQAVINGYIAADALASARNIIGNEQWVLKIARDNDQYILALRDACIAAGQPVDGAMVLSLNNAHYMASDCIELQTNWQYILKLELAGGDVLSATRWLDAAENADANAQAWADAVATAGGTVSPERLALVSTLIEGLVSGGWFDAADYWLLTGENPAQALVSLKRHALAVAVNSPGFVVDRGYSFDGISSYLDTGFVPSTAGGLLTFDSVRAAVYDRGPNLSASGYALGCRSLGAQLSSVMGRTRSGAAGHFQAAGTLGTATLPVADSRGLFSFGRVGLPGVFEAHKNGAPLVLNPAPAGDQNFLPAHPLFLGGFNNDGALSSPRACTLGFAAVGGHLSPEEEQAEYAAVQTFMTAIGAQV